MRLIDADALIEEANEEGAYGYVDAFQIVNAPTVDAVEVVRCRDCIHYHKAHVLCPDGTEKDFSEFPQEELSPFGFVSLTYGINVSGMCEFEKNCGYEVDKSVYRKQDDFCSRGKRKGGDGNG